ncbi:hypothetical protein, partial [Paenibacillus jilunlii]
RAKGQFAWKQRQKCRCGSAKGQFARKEKQSILQIQFMLLVASSRVRRGGMDVYCTFYSSLLLNKLKNKIYCIL